MVKAAEATHIAPEHTHRHASSARDDDQTVSTPPFADEDAFGAMSVGMLIGVPFTTLGVMALFGYVAWGANANVEAFVVSTIAGGVLIGMYLGGLLGMAALVERSGH